MGEIDMVSYKELYEKTKKQLRELESNSIDLRNKKTLTFDLEKWIVSKDGYYIYLEKRH